MSSLWCIVVVRREPPTVPFYVQPVSCNWHPFSKLRIYRTSPVFSGKRHAWVILPWLLRYDKRIFCAGASFHHCTRGDASRRNRQHLLREVRLQIVCAGHGRRVYFSCHSRRVGRDR